VLCLAVLGLSLSADRPARAEEPAQSAPPTAPWSEAGTTTFSAVEKYALNLQLRAGGAKAPFFTRAFPNTLGHGFVLSLAGAYRLRARTLLSVQVPLVILELAQPGGSFVDVFSWGNVNVSLFQRDRLWQGQTWRLFAVASASAALPTAQWGPRDSVFGLRALQVANAMDALRQQELYSSGVVPLAGGYGLLLEHPLAGFEASLKVPVFLRFSRAQLPDDVHARWFSLTPLLHFGARYTPLAWLDLLLAADTVFNGYAPVRTARQTATTQFSLAPALSFHLRARWRLRADFIAPVAGPLGGHAYTGVLQLGFEP
jgi:hypothetical protein